jgi:hypothetical protein
MSDGPVHESLAGLYLATIVRVEIGSEWVAAHQAALRLGVSHVLTAWNLGNERPGREANDAANRDLHELLVSEGRLAVRALGSDPNSEHFEGSWCVTGLSDRRAREIGAQFGQ